MPCAAVRARRAMRCASGCATPRARCATRSAKRRATCATVRMIRPPALLNPLLSLLLKSRTLNSRWPGSAGGEGKNQSRDAAILEILAAVKDGRLEPDEADDLINAWM